MDLPRAKGRRSSKQQGWRGWRSGRVRLHAVASVLAAVAVLGAVPTRGSEPPSYPVVAAHGKSFGPSDTVGSSTVRPAVRRPSGLQFVPSSSGIAPRAGKRTVFFDYPNAVDPTTITSITKTWVESSQSWAVQIDWTGGAAPYTVVKSTTPSFESGVQSVGKEISGNSFTDQIARDSVDNLFYNVTDPSVNSPAVEGLGYEPEPAPGPPSLVNPIGWWGSEMQLIASYLDPIAPANLSFFNRLAAKAFDAEVPSGSSYSNWAKFTVPLDARSSIPACIQAHQWVSPGSSVMVMRPDLSSSPGPSLTAVRGVVWAERTGNLWIAADDQVAEVDLFRVDPQKYTKVEDKAKPCISRVSEGDYFVVVDGYESGVSEIFQIDVNTGNETLFAQTKDDDFTRNIQPVGIALSWDGQVSYVADGLSGKVVRIPVGAGPGGLSTITDAWGGKDDFGFADPAALDVGSGGQVFVVDATDGDVWQLTGPESGFNTTKNVGSGTHVLAIDRDLSEPGLARYRFTSAQAAAEAFNLGNIGANDPAYHGSVVYSDGTNLDLYPEDRPGQIYTVGPRDPQRVIINNSGQNVPYTSPWQVADRVISFTVDGWEGLEFRLELIDPPDTAAYAPDGGWDNGQAKKLPYEANDNSEDLQIADVGLALDPDATTWAKALNVTPGSGGKATVYLKVTDRYAGDNYQVRVKKCVPTACGADSSGVLTERVVGLSPIFTAWKRIYIERDKMFRKGGVLFRSYGPKEAGCGGSGEPQCPFCGHGSYPPCCGTGTELPCEQLEVYDWQNLSVGDVIAVFDEVKSYPFLHEEREVMDVEAGSALFTQRITMDTRLTQPYLASELDTDKSQPDFSNLHSAGVGVTSGCDLSSNQINATNSCFYQADLQGVEQAYYDAFMEVSAPRGGMGTVPLLPESFFSIGTESTAVQDDFSRTWFSHWTDDPGNPRRCLPNNYFHVVGASTSSSRAGLSRATSNTFFVLIETIANNSPPGDPFVNYVRLVTNHELGHQFSLNPCECDLHDRQNAWCEPLGNCAHPGLTYPIACIMNVEDDAVENTTDGIDRFGIGDLFEGTPGCEDKYCGPGDTRTFPKGYGAIRTSPDPR